MVRRLLLSLFIIITWSCGLGLTLAQVNPNTSIPPQTTLDTGKSLYLENCASCHIPIPPEVLPTETWKEILEKPQQHYGTEVTTLVRISQVVIWQYVSTFSRPLRPQEPQPAYVEQSRYFKALHPRVEFTTTINSQSCLKCHPGAQELNYQKLSPEWDNAP
jgi:hypothetical protein